MWPNWVFAGSPESIYPRARTNALPGTHLLCAVDAFSFCLSRPVTFTQSHTSATTEEWDVGSSQTNGQEINRGQKESHKSQAHPDACSLKPCDRKQLGRCGWELTHPLSLSSQWFQNPASHRCFCLLRAVLTFVSATTDPDPGPAQEPPTAHRLAG